MSIAAPAADPAQMSHEPAAPATLNGTEPPLTQPAGGDNPRRDPPARRSGRRWLFAGLAAGALVVAGSAVSVVLLTGPEGTGSGCPGPSP